jgi:tetratricopeptide (TPR) repeat protein
VGRIWLDQLGALSEGARALERAAEHAPSDTAILAELVRVYERENKPKELAHVLERLADLAASPAERLGYYQRIAELYAERLDEPGRAVDWHEKARALDASYLPAVHALAELYQRRGEFLPLIAVHQAEAEATREPLRRAGAYARVAEIYERDLARPDDAITHYSLALGVVPGHPTSFKALVRLFTEQKRFGELASLYERAVDSSSDAEASVKARSAILALIWFSIPR